MADLSDDFISGENAAHQDALASDYDALGNVLQRRGHNIETITEKVSQFGVAIPSWGVGTVSYTHLTLPTKA